MSTTSGIQDEVVGTAKEIKGRVQEAVGAATDDPLMEARGKVERLEGEAQRRVGEEKLAGTAKQVTGKIKETAGTIAGDELLQARGKMERLEGEQQKKQ